MTIQECRAIVGAQLGFGSWLSPFDGSVSAYGDLDAAEQAQLREGVYAYILAHPGEFSAEQVHTASISRSHAPDESSDAAMIFIDEVAAQAQAINPLSSENRGSLAGVLITVAIIGAAAYFFARGGGAITISKGPAA